MSSDEFLRKVLGIGGKNSDPELPEGWDTTKIKFVLDDMVAGGTPTTSNDEYWAEDSEGIPWVKISDITAQERISKTDEQVTTEGVEEANLTIHPPGTLLVSMYASLGATSVLDISAATNQAILALYPKENVIRLKFLQMYIKAIQPYLHSLSMSNTQDNLSATAVGNIPIVLPPITDQKAIEKEYSEKSDAIKKAEERLDNLSRLLNTYEKTIVADAVTGELNED